MGAVNFYLREASEKTGRALIQLQFKYKGQRLRYSWGDSIEPEKWNPKKQRVKSSRITSEFGEHSLNDLMDNLERVVLQTYQAEKAKSGIPAVATIKKALDDFMNQNIMNVEGDSSKPTFFSLIDRFIDGEVNRKGLDMKRNTLKNYATTKGHLLEFQTTYRYKVDFDTITMEFFDKFVSFLKKRKVHKYTKEKGLSQNSIAKTVTVIKAVMNRAVLLKYTYNLEYKNPEFNVTEVEPEAVYLTDKEIMQFYRYDFSADEKLEKVRDLFVFGCYVGLRYSDYSNVQPANIVEIDGDKYIKLRTKKTGEPVIIPCNTVVLDIFKKYDNSPNKLPKAYSNVRFNFYLKEAARAAGLIEKGRLADSPELELCDCISSHTARRSFATNLYLQSFPTIEIMKITGHRTERSFQKYIRVNKLDAAKRLSDHYKKKWGNALLKVAS